ncbi:hypothetical protein ACOIEC_002466, partial [Acinetobacter baumannii]
MNKFIYMLGLVLLIGCSEKILNFTIDNVVKSNEKLNFSINFKDNKALDKVRELSSKKIVCNDSANHDQKLDT